MPDVVFADVVVVGAGISGALMTRALHRAGHHVVVVDRRHAAQGSTSASTALLQFELDVPLFRLAEMIGWTAASRIWLRSARAVREIGAIVRADDLRCEHAARRSLYLAGDAYGHRALAEEARARQRAGLPTRFLNADALSTRFGIARTGALLSRGAAVTHPVRLTAGVLRRLQRDDVCVYHGVDVASVERVRDGALLVTRDGRALIAKAVIFCTGYELPVAIPDAEHFLLSTWAIAARPTTPVPTWLRSTVVWEASDPYLYLRRLPDGSLVAGGRDEAASDAHTRVATLARKARAIVDDVESLLPAMRLRVTHRWGGTFGASPTSLPLIDRLPDHDCAWVVAGFGGNGLTFSAIAANVVCRALANERDPDARWFRLGAVTRTG